MAGLLGQILVSLVAALGIGLSIGLLLARSRGGDTEAGERALTELVAREAALIEELARARDDLQAHAVELADANAEITFLLNEVHEARSPTADPEGLRSI